MAAAIRLLVALDFDDVSEDVLDAAIGLARRLGASITALHVCAIGAVPQDAPPADADVERSVAEDETRLLEVLARHDLDATSVNLSVRVGRPADEICRAAEELDCDVIVVGIHGRGSIGRARLGSVTLNVLRHARLPVLSIQERRGRLKPEMLGPPPRVQPPTSIG